MRIVRTIVAVALLAAPVVAYTLPTAALAAIEDSTKNDAQILKDAQNKLKNKRFSGVHVAVQSGVATLSGSVPLYADKQDAAKNVGKVKNVVSVVNDIQVQAGESTDQQLADRIGKQLAYDRVGYGNAFNAITVSVNNGVVTLGGHALGPVAKESALNLAKRTPGVTNVVDKIEVDPLSPFDNQTRIAVARRVYGYPSLNKYAINPANPIRITVINGHVILSGVVDSQSDKDVAGIQANSVPGVFSVTNNLQVAGSSSQEKRQ
ncbi:MAG TPA: BON domain-containing protein [Acidobacteriaceae bacterium]|nr:BON domain-containing protein [Acidobacteriaceae bacterium]